MNPTQPFVRVVVLAFDGAAMTVECIDSILRSTWPEDRLEVVLVDNGSIDDVVSRVRSRFAQVRMIEPLRNLGFAGGCNAGIRATECSRGTALQPFDFVALVNNDATVQPGWLESLVEALDADDRIGAACPKILLEPTFQEIEVSQLFPDDPSRIREPLCVSAVRVDGHRCDDQVSFDEGFSGPSEFSESAGEEFARWTSNGGRIRFESTPSRVPRNVSLRIGARVPGLVRLRTDIGEYEYRVDPADAERSGGGQFVDCELPTEPFDVVNNAGSELYIGGSSGDRGFLERDRGQFDEPAEVFAWCGGAVLLRKSYLDDVGLFDDAFFLYYEDTDLSWRGRLRGWRYAYTPAAVVRHRHAQSSVAGSPLFRFQVDRNRLLVLVKNAPASIALSALLGDLNRAIRIGFGDVVFAALRLRLPKLREFRLRWKVLRSFVSLLPHVVRERAAVNPKVSRRRVMRLAVDKLVPHPVFAPPSPSAEQPRVGGARPRAAVYNLFWETLGGGEVVSGEMARVLGENFDVTLLGPTEPDREVFADRLGIDLSNFAWRQVDDDEEASRASSEFDLFVNCTYSSRAENRAPIGLYYVYFPRSLVPRAKEVAVRGGIRLVRMMAELPVRTTKFATAERVFRSYVMDDSWTSSYTTFIATSAYTQRWIEQIWNCRSEIVHPPVRARISDGGKLHSIASIGRFFDPHLGHSKKQLEMLTSFADMARSRDGVGDWRLVLVGGADAVSRDYVMRIRRAAQGLPIDVHVNASRDLVVDTLTHAEIYWHAGGYGVDELRHPERFEHFGIAIVEAMAAGAVPLVYGAGGPAEIVRNGVDGFHWQTLEQLAQSTRRLMKDDDLRRRMSESARRRAQDFSPEVFDERIRALVSTLSANTLMSR